MDLHQLHVFQAAVRNEGFSRASQELNLSQSTISLHIKQLESELGCTLFSRVGKRVLLTDAGRLLHEHCVRIFQAVGNARQEIQELNGLQRGRVRFGTGSTTLIYQLPPVLEAYRAQFPQIELLIVSDTTDVIVRDLKSHRLDLGLVMETTEDPDLAYQQLCTEELQFALPSSHSLSKKRALSVRDLTELRFVLYEQRTVMRKLVDDYFASLNITPQIAMVMENIEAIKSVVGAGLGASVLPVNAVGQAAADKKVRLLPVAKHPIRRRLGLVTLKSAFVSRAVQSLADLIMNEVGEKSRR